MSFEKNIWPKSWPLKLVYGGEKDEESTDKHLASFLKIHQHLSIPAGLVFEYQKPDFVDETENNFHEDIPDNLFDKLFENVEIKQKYGKTQTKKNKRSTK
jgi:hypothetical protein